MKLSIRKYAELVGTTHTTVNTAIAKGFIQKGYDPDGKKIDRDIADKEWGNDFRAKQISRKIGVSQERLEDLSNIPVMEIQIHPDDLIGEAERKKTIIISQRELIKLKKETGELVNKEEMYKEMFEFGKEIRMTMQAIPDRVIDQLITMERNAAHRLLSESINEALEKLSNEESN